MSQFDGSVEFRDLLVWDEDDALIELQGGNTLHVARGDRIMAEWTGDGMIRSIEVVRGTA